jgi:NAD+ kinase
MKIALYYRHIDDDDRQAFEALLEAVKARNIEAVTVRDGDSVDGCDYLFSIGGDGTLLSSVQFVHSSDPQSFPPILGINFGHLGFLTTVGKENLTTMVEDLLEGRFSLERRTLLKIESKTWEDEHFALNEVFLHRPEGSSLLRTQVYVNGDYVATYAGDGVIVATPTGSTAYSLSCGGPILTPDSGCFVITPIGAHTLTLRPIIVPDSARLRLLTVPTTHHDGVAHADEQITLGMDSRRLTLTTQAELMLQRAPFAISLIRMNTQNFFSAIRDKLMWGTEVRQ